MKNPKRLIILIFLLLIFTGFSQTIHHDLEVNLSIADRSIEVIDSVMIPGNIVNDKNSIAFYLNRNLIPESLDASFDLIKMPSMDPNASFFNYTIRFENAGQHDVVIPLKYSGVIADEISSGAAEYARGFSDTDGMISDAGVYLAGSTVWVPVFNEPLFSFSLTVTLRKDWGVVSQGERIFNNVNGDRKTVKYQEINPTEEVYLISGPWTEYEEKSGDVLVQAFLRTPDSALAYKYLNATSGYLEMYTELVGAYPYSKFALVENFWETGFGMPSFTLLGEKIIRFPWILHTSYPHELLHNWWGNSVYVDFNKGNWCEGLTAYMADHLLKEQMGQGAEYRRTTLQKFTDYVNPENDFPLLEFRSRNNNAEEAIGYGKCLMFNHMLRKSMGDENYVNGYQSFYRQNIYSISTFDDIRESLQAFSETDLNPFFDQWLQRPGAPGFKLSDVVTEKAEAGYDLQLTLLQIQEEDLFSVVVPIAIYLNDTVLLHTVVSDQRSNTFVFNLPSQAVKLEVDPFFDVFRRLDKAEVPPTFSQVFGTSDGMIILPKKSPFIVEYTILAESWKQTQEAQGKSLYITMDDELDKLPDSTSAWIIGFENKFANAFDVQKNYPAVFDEAQSNLIDTLSKEGSLVYAVPNSENNAYTLGFVATNVKEAIPGLARLLPHYGKYSYLGFKGERPTNVLKGNFPALFSPLSYAIPYNGKYLHSSASLEPAKALVD